MKRNPSGSAAEDTVKGNTEENVGSRHHEFRRRGGGMKVLRRPRLDTMVDPQLETVARHTKKQQRLNVTLVVRETDISRHHWAALKPPVHRNSTVGRGLRWALNCAPMMP